MSGIGEFLRRIFKHQKRIHVRTNPISNSKDIVELIDRFLDDGLNYDWEWDDFISWKNNNLQAETVRLRLAEYEHLLTRPTIKEYCAYLVIERNRLAAVLGLKQRTVP